MAKGKRTNGQITIYKACI